MDPLRRNIGVATGSLLASSATLLCCVLPAVMVSLGAGACGSGPPPICTGVAAPRFVAGDMTARWLA